MGPLWLALAALAALGAYLVGWPVWTGFRMRAARDLNADRYLAWRGRAPRRDERPMGEGMTPAERRRLWIAGALGLAALLCLAAFFTYA